MPRVTAPITERKLAPHRNAAYSHGRETMAFSRETVAAVKQQADIVQIIGEKVSLAPNGANFKGLCPFHSEKTPSFMVNPSRGMYHCFGCGTGGSVIDFLMAYENMGFPEAVTTLAQRVGIVLEQGAGAASAGRARELLQEAEQYYHDTLLNRPEGEPARRYLRERGFEEQAWAAFKMGFVRSERALPLSLRKNPFLHGQPLPGNVPLLRLRHGRQCHRLPDGL